MSQAALEPQVRRFSIAQLALLLPWVALVIGAWGPLVDNSFLWHIRSGTLQMELGAVLTTDPFSFTMNGEPWLTQSWLAELLYGWLESFTGLDFVPIMILLTGTVTFAAVGLMAYGKSRSVPATVFVLVLTTLALISFLVPRPVLFSFLLMSLVVLAWDRPSLRWSVPFLFWVWAAVHASFFIGLAYIGLVIIMEREWREIPKAIVAASTTLVTAHGLGVITFLIDFGASRDALQYLTEWRRPGLLDPVFIPLAGGIVFIVIGAVRQLIRPKHLWLLVPFLVLSFTSVRAIPPAWLALAPLMAISLAGLNIGNRAGLRAKLAVVFGLVVFGMPFLLIKPNLLDHERFPIDAVAGLDASRLFHSDIAGGFLIWGLGPSRQVYIDDRAELYGERMAEFVGVRRGDLPWKPVFERDGIGQVLLAGDEPLVASLEAAGWRQMYSDENFVVLRP